MIKKTPLLFLFLFVLACATQKPTIIDVTGRQLPTPSYTLQSTTEPTLTVLFYFTRLDEIKDLDGSPQAKPIYLNMLKHNEIPIGSKVVLTIEINNPKKIQYTFWERVQTFKTGGSLKIPDAKGGRIAVSNLDYRNYNYTLPMTSDLQAVNYGIDVIGITGGILFHIGDFNYTITGGKVTTSSDKVEPPITNNVKGGITDQEKNEVNKN